jgi:predicted dehydrogenase
VEATAAVAGAILRRGYSVLLEKPPGDSVRACRSIIRAAEAGRAGNMVAFNRRYCPVLIQAKQEALKRGPIKGASARMYRHARDEDGFFFGTGIHSLDALRFLAGDMDAVEPGKRVLVRGERPSFTTFIEYSSGGIGTFVARPQAGLKIERYEVFAHESLALVHAGIFPKYLDGSGACLLYERNQPVRLPDPLARFRAFRGPLRSAAIGGFFGEQERFVMALHGKAAFEPAVAETLQSVEIVEAVQAGRRWKRRAGAKEQSAV